MRATPGVEAVDRDSYRRTISFDGRFGTFEVRRVAGRDYLELRIDFPDPDAFPQIAERAGRIFDVDTDPRAVSSHLRRDARLSPLVEAHPGLRVPGAWDGFELTVRAILGQQVTVKAATTLAGRLAFRYGERFSDGELGVIFPRAEVLSKADPSGLGLPKARAQAIPQLARAVCRGELSFNGTPDLRAFVATDLGLLRGASSGRKGIQPKTLLGRAEKWRPFRAYAAMYLWKSYGMKMTGTR
jgi:AraC family transcriptional regulator of adaptative response / DNA-3-methyladenine glycosylase II